MNTLVSKGLAWAAAAAVGMNRDPWWSTVAKHGEFRESPEPSVVSKVRQ